MKTIILQFHKTISLAGTFLLILTSLQVNAQTTYTAVATGAWNNNASWDANGKPPNTVPAGDDVVINCLCTVTANAAIIINGTLSIGGSGTLDMDNRDLDIGNAANPNATLTNDGVISNINKLENGGNAPGLGNGPYITNSGTITADNLRIGTNPGGGYFTNTSTGKVYITNAGTSIHMDGTLCNSGEMYLTGLFFNHGGLVDCCGFMQTPLINSDLNTGRPGTFLCIDMCEGGGADPGGNQSWDDLNDIILNGDPNDVSIDDTNTYICGFNSKGEPGPGDQEYPGGVIPNLAMWLKADEGTDSPVDGDGVRVWSDQSRRGNFVQQLTAGFQPIYKNNTTDNINFNPVVDFDGSDDVLSDISGILAANTYSNINIYSVVVTDRVLSSYLFREDCSPLRISAHAPWNDGTYYWDAGSADATDRLSTAWGGSTGEPYLFSLLYSTNLGQTVSGANQVIIRNGNNIVSNMTADSFTGTNSQFNLASGNGSTYHDAKYAEFVVYTGTIDATQHNQIESYLAIKYGITLDNSAGITAGDYSASDGSLLWDASANSGYHNDVTGIGRDDLSGLEQQKSFSINGDDIILMDKGGTFSSDLGFVLWGNNDGATTLTGVNMHPDFDNRIVREWKVGVNGTPGTVTLRMIYAANNGLVGNYAINVDADGDFTSGALSYPASSLSGDTLTFENVSFSNGNFFTLGVRQPGPGGLATNLALWLKADAGTTVTTQVDSWNDQSGNGNNTSSSGNPQLLSNNINYNPAIDFDATGDYFTTAATSLIGDDNPYTKFVVANIDATVTAGVLIGTGSLGGGSSHSLRQTAAGNLRNYHGATGFANGPTFTIDETVIAGFRYGPTLNNAYRFDGAEQIDNTTHIFTDAGTIEIGGRNSGNLLLNGQIAEAIIYSSEVADADVVKIESYLAIKYGITLSNAAGGTAGDYQDSNGTIIWDAEDNSAYHNDVAGIGSDGNSALDQQKSTSINSDAMVIMDKGTSFGADYDFILWGNDNLATSLDTSPAIKHPDYDAIMTRKWKTGVKGNPGNVTLRMIYANTGAPTNYAIHVDADGDFTSGAVNYTGSSISGDTITFTNVSFADGNFFTLGLVAQGPGQVTDKLELWLKTDAGTNTTTDGAGITSWIDQSGSSNDATGTGNATYLSSFSNFKPGIDFTNDPQPISGSIARPVGTASTIIVVGNLPSTGDKALIEIGTGAGRQYFLDRRYSAGGAPYNLQTNTTTIWSVSDPGSTTAEAIYENGKNSYSTKTVTTDWTAGGTYYLGDDRDGGNGLTGEIAEVIYYDQQLSAADQQKVESYLAIKYGVTITNDNDGNTTTFEAPNGAGINEGDYVNGLGTVIWNAFANQTYHNDVAGIGRDDNSIVDQQKSLSANTDAMVVMDKGSTFSSDLDFLLWGNDNGAATSTSVGAHPNYNSKLSRTWMVAVTGTPGNVNVRFIYGNTGAISDYGLLVDSDTDFSSGAVVNAATSISGDTITFANVPFANGDFFTLGLNIKAPGFVTAELGLWLKTDAGTNTTTNGGDITLWEDQSPGGYDATDADVTGNKATYLTSFSNFNPALDFTGGEHPISGDIERTNGTASTIFVVGNTGDNTDPLMEIGTAGEPAYFFGEMYAGSNGDFAVSTNTNSIWAVSDPGGGSGTLAEIFEDGLNIGTQDKDEDTDWTTGGYYYIGDDRQSGGKGEQGITGEIAEVIYYDQQLSAAEQQRVETYLAIKYGITLDNSAGGAAGDYVASDATVVWNADDTDYSTYHIDVTGIARDDNSALDQQKSFNNSANDIVLMDKAGAFSNDLDYVIWGHDIGDTILTPTNPHPDFDEIMPRKWKVGINGNPAVSVRMILSGNTGKPSNYSVHVDADGDFTDGNATNFPATSISGDTITFANVTFTSGDYFTMGQVQRAPGGVDTGLTMWLRSDEGPKNGGAAITSGAVDEWEEASGNATVTELTSASDDPVLSANGMNYNPSIYFDGVDDNLVKNDFDADVLFSDQDNTIFFVFQRLNPNNADVFGGWEADDDTDRAAYFEASSSGKLRTDLFDDANKVMVGSSDLLDKNVIARVYSDNTNRLFSINGLQEDSEPAGSMTAAGHQGDFALGHRPENNNWAESNTSELIIYNDALIDDDIKRVETYLAIKYAITLDNSGDGSTGSYVASNGSTTIWDASTSVAYHNEIIVVGRDDNSALNQKQSHHQDDSLKIFIDALAADNASNSGFITNDLSFISIGHNGERMLGNRWIDKPAGTFTRLQRVWKVTNTNFVDTYTIEFETEDIGSPDFSYLRLLVDDDGDFSDATIFDSSDGLTFTQGSIIVGGINTTHIPAGSTKYISIASVSSAIPLPIELIDFTATVVEGSKVELGWKTASETNNDFFTIERSVDGVSWDAILEVEGAGNSRVPLAYSTVDKDPYHGISYYRLKQTDFDGQFEYSSARVVNNTYLDNAQIKIYPNPGNSLITLEGSLSEIAEFRVYNVYGQDISESINVVGRGNSALTMDISNLPDGLYMLKTKNNAQKIIKN